MDAFSFGIFGCFRVYQIFNQIFDWICQQASLASRESSVSYEHLSLVFLETSKTVLISCLSLIRDGT